VEERAGAGRATCLRALVGQKDEAAERQQRQVRATDHHVHVRQAGGGLGVRVSVDKLRAINLALCVRSQPSAPAPRVLAARRAKPYGS